jgi:hypothetical protein
MEDEIYDSSMLSRHKLTYRRIFTIFLQATKGRLAWRRATLLHAIQQQLASRGERLATGVVPCFLLVGHMQMHVHNNTSMS